MCRAAFDGTIGTWTARRQQRSDRRSSDRVRPFVDRSDAVRRVRRRCPAIRRRCLRRAHRPAAADAHRRRRCRAVRRRVGRSSRPPDDCPPPKPVEPSLVSDAIGCRRRRDRWVADDGPQHRAVAWRRHHDPGNRRRQSGSALLWYRGRDAHPDGDPLERVLQGRVTPLRTLGGVALALAGVVALVARGRACEQLPAALAALGHGVGRCRRVGRPLHRSV